MGSRGDGRIGQQWWSRCALSRMHSKGRDVQSLGTTSARHSVTTSISMTTRGRLAPSPTGRLHLGNLSSSLLAWAHARAADGTLALRIEDLDPPRCVDGAEARIIDDLKWLGIAWDDGPDSPGADERLYRQSLRADAYRDATEQLRSQGLVYPCFCSRRDIQAALSAPHAPFDEETLYPGTCAHLDPAEAATRAQDEAHALRFRATGDYLVGDGIVGEVSVDVSRCPGDFVLRRKDGLYSYQLAVVVDDAAMGITDVVRGRDLLESTGAQLALFDALGAPPPRPWHVPLLVDARGERLSKRSASVARDGLERAGWTPALLRGALACLWGWDASLSERSMASIARSWSPDGLDVPSIAVPDAFFDGPDAFRRWLADR